MNEILKFAQENQALLVALGIAILSEAMALNPKWKANGILNLILNLLKKK